MQSNRQRNKLISKPKQQWQVKKPTKNWLELPSDLMANILQRIGVVDILENAQKVCTAWRRICKDPAMWRVIHMEIGPSGTICREMCKHAVDRSQGQLLELTMVGFCDHKLLQYVADRSSQLRHLEVKFPYGEMNGFWGEAFKKLSLLEELSVGPKISKEDIEAAGRYCPMLKTLKVNHEAISFWVDDPMIIDNEIALAIGKNLPQLTNLELIGNNMSNIGLEAILDGCCHLESLDLRECLFLDLHLEGELGALGKRCSQQIKHLKLPHEPLEDEYNDFDDYTAFDNDPYDNLDHVIEAMTFMDMF